MGTHRRHASLVLFGLALAWFNPLRASAADAPTTAASRPAVHVAHDALKKLAWQLAVPTGAFQDRTVFETIDLLHSLDVHHLELTPGQPMSTDDRAVTAGHTMTDGQADALLAKLKSVRMDVVSYGPVDLGKDNASARAVFAFAKRLKVKDVIASPPAADLDRLDKLASEFAVNLAIADGLTGAGNSAPANLVMANGLSPRTGSYADLNYRLHAGTDSAEVAQRLQGRIVQIRALMPTATKASLELEAIALRELARQGFHGVVTAPCEPGTGDNVVISQITSLNALSVALESAAAAP